MAGSGFGSFYSAFMLASGESFDVKHVGYLDVECLSSLAPVWYMDIDVLPRSESAGRPSLDEIAENCADFEEGDSDDAFEDRYIATSDDEDEWTDDFHGSPYACDKVLYDPFIDCPDYDVQGLTYYYEDSSYPRVVYDCDITAVRAFPTSTVKDVDFDQTQLSLRFEEITRSQREEEVRLRFAEVLDMRDQVQEVVKVGGSVVRRVDTLMKWPVAPDEVLAPWGVAQRSGYLRFLDSGRCSIVASRIMVAPHDWYMICVRVLSGDQLLFQDGWAPPDWGDPIILYRNDHTGLYQFEFWSLREFLQFHDTMRVESNPKTKFQYCQIHDIDSDVSENHYLMFSNVGLQAFPHHGSVMVCFRNGLSFLANYIQPASGGGNASPILTVPFPHKEGFLGEPRLESLIDRDVDYDVIRKWQGCRLGRRELTSQNSNT